MSFVRTVNPGRMNKRVEIWRYVEEPTELAATKTALKRVACVWAELKPTRGKEFLEYYRESNSLQFTCTMRWNPELHLSEKDVLVYKDRQFEINSILNLMEEGRYLEVYCTEKKDRDIGTAALISVKGGA